jgi:uncharacterized membrane protein
MKSNEGTIDRLLRGVAGIALLYSGLVLASGTVGIVLTALGAILLVTGVVGFCPLYAAFHLNTSKRA